VRGDITMNNSDDANRGTTYNMGLGDNGIIGYYRAKIAFIPSGAANQVSANIAFFNKNGDLSSSTLTERMRIDTNGNVGIGTSSPILGLTIKNDAGSTTYGQRAGSLVLESNNVTGGGGTDVVWSTGTQTNQRYASIGSAIEGNDGAGGSRGAIVFANKAASATTTLTERMRIATSGEVLVAGNTDNGAFNLQCNGTGVWGAGAYVNGSDARIKEDVAPIASGLDVVEKLNPVTYRYKESWSKDQSIQPGFIAQELLTALEKTNYVDGVVTQGGSEGYYSVAYQNLIPVLTKAIQEQQEQINQLKAEIASLKGA